VAERSHRVQSLIKFFSRKAQKNEVVSTYLAGNCF